jgi:hypothetical protein
MNGSVRSLLLERVEYTIKTTERCLALNDKHPEMK